MKYSKFDYDSRTVLEGEISRRPMTKDEILDYLDRRDRDNADTRKMYRDYGIKVLLFLAAGVLVFAWDVISEALGL